MTNEQVERLKEIWEAVDKAETGHYSTVEFRTRTVRFILTLIDEQRGEIAKWRKVSENDDVVLTQRNEDLTVAQFKLTNVTTERDVANQEIERLNDEINLSSQNK